VRVHSLTLFALFALPGACDVTLGSTSRPATSQPPCLSRKPNATVATTPIPTFSKCWASPPHLAKVGLRHFHLVPFSPRIFSSPVEFSWGYHIVPFPQRKSLTLSQGKLFPEGLGWGYTYSPSLW
jgi:hypothetical protein